MSRPLDDYLKEHNIDMDSTEMQVISLLIDVQLEYAKRAGTANNAPGGFEKQQEEIMELITRERHAMRTPMSSATTQLVKAIEGNIRDVLLKSAQYSNISYREPNLGAWRQQKAAILLAIADAVDAQIGEDEREGGVIRVAEPTQEALQAAVDEAASVPYTPLLDGHERCRNQEKARMRTFTAALREVTNDR
jgi:hypothetical protein